MQRQWRGLYAPFVDGETIVVAHVDVTRISPAPIVALLTRVVPDAGDEFAQGGKELSQSLAVLRREHVTELYAVVSLGGQGLVPRVTLLVLPWESKPNLEAVRAALAVPSFVNLVSGNAPPADFHVVARPELQDALTAAGDAAVQIALIPPASSRRVIEEIMPQMPKEIGGGPSSVLTRGISWAAAAVDLSPTAAVRLTIKSQDAQAAEALRARWLDGMKLAGRQKEIRQALPEFEKIALLLTPKLAADHLTLDLDEKEIAASGLWVPLQRAAEKARDKSQLVRSMNNLKQLALAMWNWNSTFSEHFPAAAIHGKDGKPLLSWRVTVLPFLEREKLYREFHLDEPWDSPHNKSLIAKMPAVFRSPRSKAAEGFTNYVVPVGGGALYSSPKDEPTVKDITDGTSHTIMLVEVGDEHAVPWTKPDDMPFDPSDPKKGIGRLYEQGFAAAFCDASVRFLPKTIVPEALKAYFTRAAGDPYYSDPPTTTP